MSSINSLTVIHEKHQILPDTQTHVHTGIGTQQPCLRGSYPVANPGDDGVQILHFPLQQHHPGTLSAGLIRVVQHHVHKVPQFAGNARVLEKSDIWQRLYLTDSYQGLYADKRHELLKLLYFVN